MRAVFVGAGSLTVNTARQLLGRGHEVVIIEMDREVIDALGGELDCGFLHGDGAKPVVLQEADPEHTDYLFCFTGSDQTNIIASLVGQSLGFRAVVPKIEDPEFDHICMIFLRGSHQRRLIPPVSDIDIGAIFQQTFHLLVIAVPCRHNERWTRFAGSSRTQSWLQDEDRAGQDSPKDFMSNERRAFLHKQSLPITN